MPVFLIKFTYQRYQHFHYLIPVSYRPENHIMNTGSDIITDITKASETGLKASPNCCDIEYDFNESGAEFERTSNEVAVFDIPIAFAIPKVMNG